MEIRWWDKVAVRQARQVIAVALTIGVAFSIFQIYLDYAKQKSLLTSTIFQVISTTKNAAAEAAYNIDIQLANEVANGLFEYSAIVEIKIIDELGTELANKAREPAEESFRWLAQRLFGEKSEFTVALFHNERPNFSVGEMYVRIDPRETAAAFLERSFITFGSGILRNLILAIILTWLFFRLVARPLGEIAIAFAAVDSKNPEKTELPVPTGHEKDEFRMLVNAGNGMLYAISTELAHRSRAEEELRIENEERRKVEQALLRAQEELELRVEERTRDLRHEITERKFVEATLRQSQERFRDIAESTSDWFWEMGPDLCYTYISPRGYEITGLTPGDVIGKKRMELRHGQSSSFDEEKWKAHQDDLENRRPFQKFEYTLSAHDGHLKYYQLSGKPFFDEDGSFQGYRGAARDVTRRREREADLRAAKIEADKANMAKSEFLSSMSHELRTPLNGVLGFAQLLQISQETPLSDQQGEYVGHILKAGDHLLELINEVLDLAKIESGSLTLSLEKTNLKEVVSECVELLSPLAERREIVIIDDISDTPLLTDVMADFTRLKQVLVNIMSNGIKYNREGGELHLSCENIDDRFVRVYITDKGFGIPETRIDSIFTPFNRLGAENSEIEGTGVGLTITKRLIELMGGAIDVRSEVGEGSSFWIDLPMVEGDVPHNTRRGERDKAAVRSMENLQNERQTILYVEDNPANLELMEQLLGQFSNVRMLSAHTAELGLELAAAHLPDVVILDINLPGMDGYQALELLRQREETRHIPVLALSANAMSYDIKKGLAAGFREYLTKPLNVEKTLIALKSALDAATANKQA